MILGGKPIIRGTRIRANMKPIEENVSLKILVTGASGYIGGQVAQRLFKDGNDVVCMTRGNKAVGSIPTVQGDLLDPKSLLNACRGVDVIRVKYFLHISAGGVTGPLGKVWRIIDRYRKEGWL
jgi:nucleoside-diphosphate-sugar epimerase